MRSGLLVRITDSTDGGVSEHAFDHFPVRIGRSPLNDLTLDLPFVSEFHAVVERQEGRLLLLDLGSTNGTVLRGGGRVVANEPLDLLAHDGEFAIAALVFHVEPVEVESPPRSRLPDLPLDRELAEDSAPPASEASASTPWAEYESYRASWRALLGRLDDEISKLPVDQRDAELRRHASMMPAVVHEPEFVALRDGPAAPLTGGATDTRQGAVALQGLRELARKHVLHRGAPESAEHLFHFLNRLNSLLDVFFRSFVALRDGHQQLTVDLNLTQTMGPKGPVAEARTAEELAAVLLDWQHPSRGEAIDLEGNFANLMIQQVALLSGVMSGVKQLLEELSPGRIEAAAESRGRLGVGPFRFKSLWSEYQRRHDDLSAGDRHVFAVIFGQRFYEAYRRFQGERFTGAAPKPSPRP